MRKRNKKGILKTKNANRKIQVGPSVIIKINQLRINDASTSPEDLEKMFSELFSKVIKNLDV